MTHAITARHDLPIWRNDDYYEYPIRVIGLDLTGIVLKMDVRLEGDTPGPPLIALRNVSGPLQGLWLVGVTIVDGVPVSDLRIRIDRPNLQALDYTGDFGEAAEFAYALLFGGRTRLYGNIILPPHAFGSDAAPDDRVPSYGYGRQAGVPDAGVTLTISQDGGLALTIDGAGLVSEAAGSAEAAAERADDAADRTEAIASTSYRAVPGYAEREAIPLNQRGNGMRVQTMVDGRISEWRTDMLGPAAWTGLMTQAELIKRELQTGKQNQDTINGLPEALSGLDGVDANLIAAVKSNATLKISNFAVIASSSSGPFEGSWSIDGVTPRAQRYVWSNWGVDLDGGARAFTPQDWTKPTGLLAIGDSMLDNTVPYKVAALIGLTPDKVSKAALYSAGSKQVYRVGARPIFLTVTGNRLPAGGVSVAVTAINGAAPGANNPASLLFTSVEDTNVNTIAGMLAGQHVTLSAAGGSANYSAVSDAGSPAVDVPAGSLFVPDFALRIKTDIVLIRLSQNYFFSPFHPQNINPQIWDDIDLIVRQTRGNRVIIEALTPDATWLPAKIEYGAVRAFRDGLKLRWPQFFAVDALGRDNLDRMIASGSQSAGNIADRANGVVPRTLREDKPDGTKDTLHLNDDGETIEAQGIYEYYQRQALPPAMTIDTKVSLFADATDGLGGAMPATAVILPQARSTAAIVERNANYTARAGETIYADTSAASFTITLPAGGGIVTIVDAARSWATNPLTIAGNGGTVDGAATMSTADFAEYAIAFRRPASAAAWSYALSYQYGA